MSLACVYSRARVGLESPLVTVEVHLANGLPAFQMVICYALRYCVLILH
jgi:magnesium chelatase family protein